jgi:hypothetical protein
MMHASRAQNGRSSAATPNGESAPASAFDADCAHHAALGHALGPAAVR